MIVEINSICKTDTAEDQITALDDQVKGYSLNIMSNEKYERRYPRLFTSI